MPLNRLPMRACDWSGSRTRQSPSIASSITPSVNRGCGRTARRLSDDALAAQIQAAGVAIYVLYADGQPAGYVELDARVTGDVELVFCGLMPWAIGRGLGPWMLRRATVLAWDQLGARRFWVHTCSFDHPSALGMYKAAGFVPFAREVNIVPDPRADGLIPMNAAPHVPMTT